MKRIETLLGSIGDSSVPLIDTLEDLRYSLFLLSITEKIIRSLKYTILDSEQILSTRLSLMESNLD